MRVMARLKEPHFQMTWMQRLEPSRLSESGWDKENALVAVRVMAVPKKSAQGFEVV